VELDATPLAARFTDLYGNPCTRVVLPIGTSIFRYSAGVDVADATEDADELARELAPEELPDDALMYTLPSRYCLPDVLGDEAWARFGSRPRGCPGAATADTCVAIATSEASSRPRRQYRTPCGVCPDRTPSATRLPRLISRLVGYRRSDVRVESGHPIGNFPQP